MVKVPARVCSRCGRFHEVILTSGPDPICNECHQKPPTLTRMRAPLCYMEPTSRIIHRFKYEGLFALADPLARFLIAGWPEWTQPPDLVLPVPLHPRRMRQRGYNQSELLARPLSMAKRIAMEPTLLQRTRHTMPQVGLGPEDRLQNVRGAFTADAAGVRGCHVMLVDDVLTTGATMSAAAEALLEAGATSVAAYCLARVS